VGFDTHLIQQPKEKGKYKLDYKIYLERVNRCLTKINAELKIRNMQQSINKTCKTVNHRDTYILVMKMKPFRDLSKTKTSSEQQNPRNH
jgi:hypothetical protein